MTEAECGLAWELKSLGGPDSGSTSERSWVLSLGPLLGSLDEGQRKMTSYFWW